MKADPAPIDPAAMYESLKNRIAALEEEEVFVEEEERRYGARVCTSVVVPRPYRPYVRRLCATAEEAQKHVRGLEENAVHVKYIELVRVHRRPSAPLARVLSAHSLQSSSAWSASTRRRSRSCSRTRTLVRLLHPPPPFFFLSLKLFDANVAKGQLTKANQTKIKMENLARELQKVRHVLSANADTMGSNLRQDNKRLRVSECFQSVLPYGNPIIAAGGRQTAFPVGRGSAGRGAHAIRIPASIH